MYDFLKMHNEEMSSENLQEFLMDLFGHIFDDVNVYREFRTYANKLDVKELYNKGDMSLDTRLLLDRQLYYLAPMIDSLKDDEKTLAGKWKSIVRRWFEASGHNMLQKRSTLFLRMRKRERKQV